MRGTYEIRSRAKILHFVSEIIWLNKTQKAHYSALSSFGCILCYHLGHQGTPAEIHHIRRHGQPRDDAPVIPLCPYHHRGSKGVHGLGKKRFPKYYNITEEELLALTLSVI